MQNKLIKISSGDMYVSEVISETGNTVSLRNPMLVDYKYNAEQTPMFRYIPWQILSDEPEVKFAKTEIVFMAVPKADLLDVYQRICMSFIPDDVDDEDDD